MTRKKMRLSWIPSCCFLALAGFVGAEKDSDYYYPGFTNPNTKLDMYWKDSINVLQDLDQFESLYVKYHHCVWSKYGSRYGSGENYDEQGQDQDDDDDDGTGCGGFGGEYFWYMGRTQCFKANAAYSLYGILKGESADSSDACSKKTYINSFFTTFGVESFTGPLGLGVDDANAQCANNEPENGDNENYDDYVADDDYLDDNYQFYNYKAYTSQGTGCSANGAFVTDSYQGAFCHGRNYQATVDDLQEYNEMLNEQTCTQIYDAFNYNNNDDERRRRRLDGNDDDYDFEEMDALDILKYSKSCSLRQYPHDCPDPFGLKRKYSRSMDRADHPAPFRTERAIHIMKLVAYGCLGIGILFLTLSFLLQRRILAHQQNNGGKWRRAFGNRNNKQGRSESPTEVGIEQAPSSNSGGTTSSTSRGGWFGGGRKSNNSSTTNTNKKRFGNLFKSNKASSGVEV